MITLLWLSCAHRSQHTTPAEEAFSPYSTPARAAALAGSREARSGEANGKAAASAYLVGGEGQAAGDPPLQGAERGGLGRQQQRLGQRPHRGHLGGQRVLAGGVDGQVQAGAEQAALAAGDTVGQLPRVLGGGLGLRVGEPAPLA